MNPWIATGCVVLLAASMITAATHQTSADNCTDFPAAEHAGWEGMETAPKDRAILLGLLTEAGFVQGVGRWEVRDELGGGIWSAEEWWGRTPTHWAPIPPPPGAN